MSFTLMLRKLHHIFPSSHYVLLSLFFFAGLELLFVFHSWLLIWVAILLVVLLFGIALIRFEEGVGFHSTQIILPSMAAIGFTSFGLFLPSTMLLHAYFIGCALLFFFILKYGARLAWPTWNWVISLFVLFSSVAALLGWRFYVYAPVALIIALFFITVFLIALQSLRRYTPTSYDALLLSLSMAFVLSEIVWVLQFLPLHFIVETGIVIAAYYVMFRLIIAKYEDNVLTLREILEHTIIGAIALAALLLTAQWI